MIQENESHNRKQMILRDFVNLIIALIIIVSGLFTLWVPHRVSAAPAWPTTWISIGTDPDEGGGDDFRDVLEAYYQADSAYLFLRLRTVIPATFQSGNKDSRYKWFVDTNNDMTLPGSSGGTVYNWEYLFYVEDTDNNGTGDIYLGTPSNPVGALITNTDLVGYRLNSGGNYVDLYIRLDQISNLADYWVGWATDQENKNYDQAPKLDSTDSTAALHLITKGAITVIKTVVGSAPPSNWQFNYTGQGTSGNFAIAAAGGQNLVSSLPFGSYTVTETTKADYICSPSDNISVTLSTAQTSQTITFTNTLAAAPTVTTVDIYEDPSCTIVASSMTPQITYYARVGINIANYNLVNLQTVRVTLFYDAAGTNPVAPATANTQTCAILTCAVGSPPTWTIEPNNNPPNPPDNTTWQIITAQCVQPNLNTNTGNWIFAFKPGKVATESVAPANWDAQGKAIRNLSQTGELYVRNKAMNWYGEIIVPASVDWGQVPLGLTFNNATYNPRTASIKYIANGDYYEDIKSSDSWTGTGEIVTLDTMGNNPPPPGMFALLADNTANIGDAVVVTADYKHFNASGALTGESGVTVSTNNLWLSLGPTDIAPVTYSGTIYCQIANR
jgi:hypothetical protein